MYETSRSQARFCHRVTNLLSSKQVDAVILRDGEQYKTMEELEKVWNTALEKRMDRGTQPIHSKLSVRFYGNHRSGTRNARYRGACSRSKNTNEFVWDTCICKYHVVEAISGCFLAEILFRSA